MRPHVHNRICTLEDYTPKQAIIHLGDLSPITRQRHNQGNDTINAIFIYDITDFLADKIGKYNNIVMLGDLNMHVDDLTNADAHIFNDTMQAFGLKQHVTSPTHKYSHILDLVYSEMNSELNLHNCKVHEFMSDHPTERVVRDTTTLTKETLEKFYTAPDIDDNMSLEQACDQFCEELCKMLDSVAPPKCIICRQAKETLVQQIYP